MLFGALVVWLGVARRQQGGPPVSLICFCKVWRLGSLVLNLFCSGISWSWRVGPWSWNSGARAHRVDLPGPLFWQGRRRR